MSMIKSRKGTTAEGSVSRENSRAHVLNLALLGLFSALILVMSFTPLGYLRTVGVDISFLMVPVAAGAVLLGPKGGTILGALFGITSFIQAAFGMSPFGAALFAINPIYTAIMCLVPRILMGLIAGLVSKAFAASEKPSVNVGVRSAVTCLITPMLNTVMFMGLLVLFFWNTEYIQGFAAGKGALPFVFAFVGLNGLLEIAASLVVGSAVSVALINVCKRTTGKIIL